MTATSRTVRRLLCLIIALVALSVAACGTDTSGSVSVKLPTPKPATTDIPTTPPSTPSGDSGDDGAAAAKAAIERYQAFEAAFYKRFQYLANADSDLAQSEDDVFVDGVESCLQLTGTGTVDDLVETLTSERGLTDDGAHAVAAAATEAMCTDTGVQVTTRTETEAPQIANQIAADLNGARVLIEVAMRDTKLACQFLDKRTNDIGLHDYMRSDATPFLADGPVTIPALNALVTEGVENHCPNNTAKLSATWSNPEYQG